ALLRPGPQSSSTASLGTPKSFPSGADADHGGRSGQPDGTTPSADPSGLTGLPDSSNPSADGASVPAVPADPGARQQTSAVQQTEVPSTVTLRPPARAPVTSQPATTFAVARWWYHGVTASQVSGFVTQNGARLIQIRVEDPAIPTFAVSMIQNVGPYASA